MNQPPPSLNWRRRVLGLGWRALRILLVCYLVLLAFMYFAQEWLIFPGRDSHGQPGAQLSDPGEGVELLRLRTESGLAVAALFGGALTEEGTRRPDASSRPTLLYCYGNAMYSRQCLDRLDDFRRLGVNVIIPEYLGYGMSEGEAGEDGCYAAAEAAYRHALQREDVDRSRIVVSGWSLGAGVAVELAARHPEVAELATFSAFTSLAEVAGREYPYLPVSLLLRHRFENERKIATVACPIFLAHGTKDEVIPFEMMDRLARAAKGPVRRFAVEGGDHNGIFTCGGPALRRAFGEFLDGVAE